MKNRFAVALVLSLVSIQALAASDAPVTAADEALVEKVVVRNRLFTTKGRFELGLNVGFSMLSRLTDHYNFALSAAWNVLETLALEFRGGYAYSRHTGLADDIADQFFASRSSTGGACSASAPTGSPGCANDLADLWEMTVNGIIGLRWQPIYGKLGLMAELPIHFQAYGWVGGGAGLFKRTSVVICNAEGKDETNATVCADYFTETKPGPIVSIAIGLRFFLGDNHAVRLEVRDYSFLDSYYVNVDRRAALNSSNPTGNGNPYPSPGLTNLVQLDLGYTYIF